MLEEFPEIISEIAKWLVPIFCRGKGLTLDDFSEEEVSLKKKLCESYLSTMKMVKPGFNKMAGKNFPTKIKPVSCNIIILFYLTIIIFFVTSR